MSELYNTDLEQAVIGGLLIDPELLPDVRALVNASDFRNEACGLAFEMMCKLGSVCA